MSICIYMIRNTSIVCFQNKPFLFFFLIPNNCKTDWKSSTPLVAQIARTGSAWFLHHHNVKYLRILVYLKEWKNVINLWQIGLTTSIQLPEPLSTLLECHTNVFLYIYFFSLNGWYWLTDSLAGFHRWARRLLSEPQWESSWQQLSIRPSSTPS